MKKIIAGLAVVLTALFYLHFSSFTSVAQVEHNGYAVSDSDVEGALFGKETPDEETFSLLKVKELEAIYERMGSFYIGEKKQALNTTYPLFFNDGKAIALWNEENVLYDAEFQTIDAQAHLVIVDGILYDKFDKQMDDTTYIFVQLSNGLFVNTKVVEIKTALYTYVLPLNSIASFEEEGIRYLEVEEDTLRFKQISDIDEKSTITIDKKVYSYSSFLEKIGKDKVDSDNTDTSKEKVSEQEEKDTPLTQEDPSMEIPFIDGEEANGNGSGSGNGGNDTVGFVEPKVHIADFTASVYTASSSITLEDPQRNLVKNRVMVEVWNGGRVTMRKFYKQSQDFMISGLAPDTNYTFKVKYEYTDKNGEKVEKELAEKTVTTKSIDTLAPFSFTYEKGALYSEQLEIKNLMMQESADEEANENLYRIVFAVEDKVFDLGTDEISALRKGENITFTTPRALTSNTSYEAVVEAYDRFGNKLQSEANPISLTTCKRHPSATLKLKTNKIGNTQLLFTLNNKDDVSIENARIQIFNRDGLLIKEEATDVDKSDYEFSGENAFDANERLTIKIIADYDVEDGKGVIKDQVLATTTFTTASLSTLGNITVKTKIPESDLYSDKVTLYMELSQAQTNADLIAMIKKMSITLTLPDGSEYKKPIPINSELVDSLKQGKEIAIVLDELDSNQRYNYEVHFDVEHGSQTYDYIAVNNVKTFQTLKRTPYFKVKNQEATLDTLSFDILVVDPDRAIVDDFISLRALNMKDTVLDTKVIECSLSENGEEAKWQHYTISGLDINETPSLWFEVFVKEMNVYHLSTKTQFNEVLKDPFQMALEQEATGNISLISVENSSNKDLYEVHFKGTVSDPSSHIDGGELFVRAYEKGSDTPEDSYLLNIGEDTYYLFDGSLSVAQNKDYVIQLEGMEDGEIQIYSSFEVNTDSLLYPIRSIEEFKNVNKKPDANYIVSENLDFTSLSKEELPNYQIKTLNAKGSIDFRGHTIIFPITDTVRGAIENNYGTLLNAQVKVLMQNEHTIEGVNNSGEVVGAGGFVYKNQASGRIENIVVDFYGDKTLPQDNACVGGIIYQNEGILNNFVIHVNTGLGARQMSGYGVAINTGKGNVTNGYVDSTAANPMDSTLDATAINKTVLEYEYDGSNESDRLTQASARYTKAIGGIVGFNDTSAKVAKVYSLVGVKNIPNDATEVDKYSKYVDENSVGTVIGTNLGTVESVFGTNEQATYTQEYFGPTVGRNFNKNITITKENKDTYYLSNVYYPNTKLNERLSKLTLNDYEFHNDIFNDGEEENGSFDIYDTVGGGYYPHIKLPSYFGLQPLNALPIVDKDEALNVKSMEVISATDDTAIVKMVINNPGSGDIRSVSIENIGQVKIIGEQIHEAKNTTIQLEIGKPKYYLSEYSVKKVIAKNNYSAGDSVEVSYSSGDKVLHVDFFRPIYSVEDWNEYVVKQGQTSYKDNIKENYKLQNDLDFKGYTPTVSDTDDDVLVVRELTTILDGNGYTIKNLDFTKSPGYVKRPSNTGSKLYYSALFGDVSGQIRNITFENIEAIQFYGLVFYTNLDKTDKQAIFDDVHVVNLNLQHPTGTNNSHGGLIFETRGQTLIQNCSVRNFTAFAENAVIQRFGGMVGYAGGTTVIKNSYVSEIDFSIQTSRVAFEYGIGGILGGYTDSTMIENVYAEGRIQTNSDRVAAIGGYSPNATLKNAIADVDIIHTGSEMIALGALSNIPYQTNATKAIHNALTIGDITRMQYLDDPMENISRIGQYGHTYVGKGRHLYAADFQLINGASTSKLLHADGLLSYEELLKPSTYTDVIGLDDNFNYDKVSNGRLPRLMKTDKSGLVEGQGDGILLEPSEKEYVEVSNVVLPPNGYEGFVDVQVDVKHSSNLKIKGIHVQNAKISNVNVIPSSSDSRSTTITFTLTPELYLDNYVLDEIEVETVLGKTKIMEVEAQLPTIFYKPIASVQDFEAIAKESVAQNYQVIKDLDFKNVDASLAPRNLVINRLVGKQVKDNGVLRNPKIKNMHVTFDGTQLKGNDANVIQVLHQDMSNIDIEDLHLRVDDSFMYYYNRNTSAKIGFINDLYGYVRNVNLHNIYINMPNEEDRVAYVLDPTAATSPQIKGQTPEVAKDENGNEIHVTSGYKVGFIVEQHSGYMENMSISNINSSGYMYVGSLVGYNARIRNVVMDGVHVQGTQYVGGVSARAWDNRNEYLTHTTVTDAEVCGYRAQNRVLDSNFGATTQFYVNPIYTGGVVAYGSSQYNTIKNSSVSGGIRVGGITGETGALNSVVDTVAVTGMDMVGGISGWRNSYSISNNIVANTTITATGRQYGTKTGMAGGILGCYGDYGHTMGGNLVSGSTITGTTMAGGIFGAMNTGENTYGAADNINGIIYFNSVYDSTIIATAENGSSGGIAGYYRSYVSSFKDNIVSANVLATGTDGKAGGIVGHFSDKPNAVGLNQTVLSRNVVHGNIKAEGGYAGGLIGFVDSESILMDANIASNILDTHLTTGYELYMLNPVFGNAYSTRASVNAMLTDNFTNNGKTGNEIKTSNVANFASLRLVSNEELKNPVTYTNASGPYSGYANAKFNTSQWNVNVVEGNTDISTNSIYPIFRWGSHNLEMVGAHSSVSKAFYHSLFPIGETISPVNLLEETSEVKALPEVSIYPSGVDSINVEFSHIGSNLSFYLNEDKESAQVIDCKVYTFAYNYDEIVALTVSDGEHEEVYEIVPEEVSRHVMCANDTYYYLTSEGITSGNQGVFAGEFVHLYDGKALSKGGQVFDVYTQENLSHVEDVTLLEEVRAIQSFTVDGSTVETFANFSLLNKETKRAMQLFMVNDTYALVDGTLDIVKDAILLGRYQEEEYQYVVGNDGVLYALKDEFVTPEHFHNEDIVYACMGNSDTLHYFLVEYANGGIVGFDYTNGEVLFEIEGEAMSFMDYAFAFFRADSFLIPEDTVKVYGDVKEFKEEIEANPIDTVLKNQETGKDMRIDMNSDGLVNEGEISTSTQFEERTYVPYYDNTKKEYVLYDLSALVEEKKEIESENSKVEKDVNLQHFYEHEATTVSFYSNRSGLIGLSLITLSISGGLFYLFRRRKKS